MAGLVKGEFRKLLATRAWLLVLLAGGLLGGGLVGMMTLVGPENFDPPMPGLDTEEGVRGILGILGYTAFVPAAIGTLAMTSEYRHRTADTTFLFEPRRWRVLAAKLLAHGVAGAAYGLVLAGTAAGAFFGASAVRGVTLGLPAADITGILARIALAMVAYMLLGIGMGALIRNQAAALVVVIGYLYAGEMTLLVIPGVRELYPWLPGGATAALTDFTAVTDAMSAQLSADPVHLLSPALGALLLLAYTALAATAAIVRPMRRDIT
ncbi:ABC transporter permease [Actinomadura bangladeshensis]|uniref:ABC transporter permease n=1 Tax=Actinomadura bangladeshensis TaxID=453573 RepID=A0A6L9QKU3_9ACTN|nr:ABC transporter permease [Actinomadura bangladeshensis]NEA24624.1 ABC transporter permease [Actinomadura bangladeshensis]